MKNSQKMMVFSILMLAVFLCQNSVNVIGFNPLPERVEVGVKVNEYNGITYQTGRYLIRSDSGGDQISQSNVTASLLSQIKAINSIGNATIVTFNNWVAVSGIPVYDTSPDSLTTNWRPMQFVQVTLNDTYESLITSQVIYPSNIPISDIYIPELMNNFTQLLYQLLASSYIPFLNIGELLTTKLVSLDTALVNTTVNVITPNELYANVTYTLNLIFDDGGNDRLFNGTIIDVYHFKVGTSGFAEKWMDDRYYNTTISDNLGTILYSVNGTVFDHIEQVFHQDAPSFLQQYWYVILIIAIGGLGIFIAYYISLKSQCKYQKEPNTNWTCKKSKDELSLEKSLQ